VRSCSSHGACASSRSGIAMATSCASVRRASRAV
jgi:hypothetical protein